MTFRTGSLRFSSFKDPGLLQIASRPSQPAFFGTFGSTSQLLCLKRPPSNSVSILHRSKTIALEFCLFSALPQRPPARPISVWKPPPNGILKINTDGAIGTPCGQSSVGGVVRDSCGHFITTFADSEMSKDPLQLELLAIRAALQSVLYHGYRNLIIESDSLSAVQLLSRLSSSIPWHVALLISDCTSLTSSFSYVSFTHCRREPNEVTNKLAALGCYSPSLTVWDDDPPGDIIPLLLTDLNLGTSVSPN